MKDGCYSLLLAAAAACLWPIPQLSPQLSHISSGATCVADLDSGALALTKEASGNSCGYSHVNVTVTINFVV